MEEKLIIEYLRNIAGEIARRKYTYLRDFKCNSVSLNDLSIRQYHLIFLIGNWDIKSISELKEKTDLSSSTLSIIISKLVKRGYVDKSLVKNPKDNRKIYYKLTAKGFEKLGELTDSMLENIFAFFGSLNIEEKNKYFKSQEYILKIIPDYENVELVKANTEKFSDLLGDKTYIASETLLKGFIYSIGWLKERFNPPEIKNQELLPTQYNILKVIACLDLHTIKEFSSALSLTTGTISLSVSKMTEQGFLERKNPEISDDGRRVYFYITKKGISAMKETDSIHILIFNKFYLSLTDDEKKYLYKGIKGFHKVFCKKELED